MAERVSPTPTPYMIHCRTHGEVYLTESEYDRQLHRPDCLWVCPLCNQTAVWDDENWEQALRDQEGS